MPRYLITFVLCALAAGCQIRGNKRLVGSVDQPLDDPKTLTSVEIVNPVGTIRVKESGPQHAAGIDAEVLLDENRPETDFVASFDQHVEVSRSGDKLRITSAHAHAADRNDWQLRMTVYLPPGVELKLDQDVGAIQVELSSSRALDVDLDTGNIDVAVAAIDGRMRVDVDTGRISVATTGSMPTGDCDLSCDTGSITLSLPRQCGGEVDLETDCGNITLDERFGLKTRRDVTEASCRGTFGSGDTKIRARVDTGSISLR